MAVSGIHGRPSGCPLVHSWGVGSRSRSDCHLNGGDIPLRKCLGLLFLLLAIIVILAGVGLLTPFTINYIDTGDDAIGQICDDCEQLGMATIECVQLCKDECCFTDMSGPLSIVILAFTATALAASVIGLGVVVAHLYFARKQSDNVRKQL